MPSENQKRPGGKKKTLVIVLCAVLGVVLLGIAAVAIWLDAAVFSRLGRPANQETLSSAEIESIMGPPAESIVPTVEVELIKPSENVINVLLIGQDMREGQERQRSDAAILCTINKTKKTITMTSFMRDMWVHIPGYGEQRINVAYYLGGGELLNKTIEHNFGVRADHCVEIDFFGFMTAVDRVGGIDMELTAKEAEYLNRRGLWDIEPNQNWTLKEGVNHLDGKQALAYSRIRDIGADFERTLRQRKVLTVLIDQAKELDFPQLYKLIYDMIPLVSTDMTDGELLGLAADVAPMLSDMEIISLRIPANGQFSDATIKGNRVLVLSQSQYKKARKLLAQVMEES